MPTIRRSAASTTLSSGTQVLIAGGVDSASHLRSIVVYDGATQRFSLAGTMDAPYDTATLLDNGTVLLADRGNLVSLGSGDSALTTAEIFNPATGALSSTGPMLEGVNSAVAVKLSDGRVLIAGGRIYNHIAAPTSDAEIYDPASGAFSFTGSMNSPRFAHSATLLANGKVLVAGGILSAKKNVPTASAELYDPASGLFSATSSMNVRHANHTATLLADGKVLIAGGTSDSSGSAIPAAEIFDPVTGGFSAVGPMQAARSIHTATLLDSGKVLIAGGTDGQNVLSSAELYDPVQMTFAGTGNMTVPREEFTANLFGNGQVLLAGGITGFLEGSLTSSAEIYTP
jgi:hypothetical protein